MSINIKEESGSVQTVKEFEKVLEIFKEKNPAKYASRLTSGDFDRQAKSLGIVWESETGKVARIATEKAKADADKAEAELAKKVKAEAKADADKK